MCIMVYLCVNIAIYVCRVEMIMKSLKTLGQLVTQLRVQKIQWHNLNRCCLFKMHVTQHVDLREFFNHTQMKSSPTILQSFDFFPHSLLFLHFDVFYFLVLKVQISYCFMWLYYAGISLSINISSLSHCQKRVKLCL